MFGTNPDFDFTPDARDIEIDEVREDAKCEQRGVGRFYRGNEVQPFDEDTCDKEAA